MRDQTTNPSATRPASHGTEPGPHAAPTEDVGQITVPSSLLDAVMAVDEARDDGGLGLQDALHRMHAELTPFIEGQPTDGGTRD